MNIKTTLGLSAKAKVVHTAMLTETFLATTRLTVRAVTKEIEMNMTRMKDAHRFHQNQHRLIKTEENKRLFITKVLLQNQNPQKLSL
jgi:hypothetical protein